MLILTSCSKKDEIEETRKAQFVEMRAQNKLLYKSLDEVWNFTYDTYSMEFLCACDCNAAQIAQSILNTRLLNLDEFKGMLPLNYNCTQLFERLSTTCSLDEIEKKQMVDSLSHTAYTQNFISKGEKDLLNEFTQALVNNVNEVPFTYFYNKLEVLNTQTNSPTNYIVTLALIMNAETTIEYFKTATPPTGVDQPQFLINKAMGAWGSAFIGALWDLYDDNLDNLPRNIVRNAVGGAITSL